MRQSQIDILQSLNEITYGLQEGRECSSQIDILQSLNEITYGLQEGRMQQSDRHSAVIKRDHVRATGGAGNAAESDRHSADIKRDRVLSAGGAGMRQSQIDILQTSKEITYALQERGEHSGVISTFCRHQKRSRTFCRRGENAAE
jgi:hypothetical protein